MCDQENIFVTGTFAHCHPFQLHRNDEQNAAPLSKEIGKMKKIVLAAAALALTAGAAFAENPRVGEPADLYANDRTPVASQKVDYTAPASIGQSSFQDGSAHRFGDASPSSYQS